MDIWKEFFEWTPGIQSSVILAHHWGCFFSAKEGTKDGEKGNESDPCGVLTIPWQVIIGTRKTESHSLHCFLLAYLQQLIHTFFHFNLHSFFPHQKKEPVRQDVISKMLWNMWWLTCYDCYFSYYCCLLCFVFLWGIFCPRDWTRQTTGLQKNNF